MKRKIQLIMLLTLFLITGCTTAKETQDTSASSQSSTTATDLNTTTSSSSAEVIPDDLKTIHEDYDLQPPNDHLINLMVTDPYGSQYLLDNGYTFIPNNDTTITDKSLAAAQSDKLPNTESAYGFPMYRYFWCSSETKQALEKVRKDNEQVFFELNADHLAHLQQVVAPPAQEQDLNIDAINNGDLSSLVGTWKNGDGEILIINADGTTNTDYIIKSVKESDKISSIPYANYTFPSGPGAALGLYKIGFVNPDGDQSDTTRPRLIIAQAGFNYPANSYYYREK